MDCYRRIQADTNGSRQGKPLELALKWDQIGQIKLMGLISILRDGSKEASSLDLILRWANQTTSSHLILKIYKVYQFTGCYFRRELITLCMC
jgi:hypothetical protein